jgi:glucose/arabinose dehydrogenase/PKD repeat protein
VLPGFQDQVVVGGLTQPTAARFASDGRIFIAEKSGLIKVFDPNSGATEPSVFADLRTEVHNYWDRGLLDLELHPDFPNTPYIYVLYSFDGEIGGEAPLWGSPGATTDRCPTPPGPTALGCVISGRLSRLEAGDDGMRGLEQVLVENWPQQFPGHSIGSLAFGPDGMLYASAGEGASFYFVDYGQVGDPPNPLGDPPLATGATLTPPAARGGSVRSQNVAVPGFPARYNGKLIRIDPETGLAAPGNPTPDPSVAGADSIIAYGLRNPFRFAFRPGTSEIWIGDVGQGEWEEIDRLTNPLGPVAENFGWPCFEGAAHQPGFEALGLTVCNELYARGGHIEPYWAYNHADTVVAEDGCGVGQASISAIAFYEDGLYPEEYRGALFFGDYTRNCIWAMMPGADGLPNPNDRRVFVQQAPQPVQLLTGPGNDLYYMSIAGELHRIAALGGNRPPVAKFGVSPREGAVPLTVVFDASESNDPDPGDRLSYAWDLDGDGTFDDATGLTVSYVYASAGERTVHLRVTDSRGAVATSEETVTAGEAGAGLSALISMVMPAQFRVGELVQFTGRGEDGAMPLPAANLQWELIVQHCPMIDHCHPHIVQDFEGVESGSFVAPEHDYPYYLDLILRVTTPDGRQATAIQRLDPVVVEVTIESDPPGLVLALNQSAHPTPFVAQVVLGSRNTVSAPDYPGYTWQTWSDAGAQVHLLSVDQSTAITARYRRSETAVQLKAHGTIIARVTEPLGYASKDLEVIRDDDYPPVGTEQDFRNYVTFTEDYATKDDWIGYEFTAPYAFSSVVFQEGRNYGDGGWFEQLTVQVRRNGVFEPVTHLVATPVYPGTSNGIGFRSYRLDFETVVGDAIRIYGPAGGALHFVSIAELDVYGWRVIPMSGAAPILRVRPAATLVLPGEEVRLDARESFDPNGSALAFAWSQTAGPNVALLDAGTSVPHFVAPAIDAAATLRFELRASTSAGATATASVEVVVTPLVSPVDISARGAILISEPAPLGAGSRDLEVIRDGIEPAVGSDNYLAQYDTFAADPGVFEGFVGYDLGRTYRLGQLRFQEGGNYVDGGWFSGLSVEVRRDGRWFTATGLRSTPAYTGASDGVSFQTFELDFTPTVGDAVRLFGAPGGSEHFFSVAELRAFAVPEPDQNLTPVAEAGSNFNVPSGGVAELDGSLSFDPDGTALNYRWEQTGGTEVDLDDETSVTPSFAVPTVSGRTQLTFELTVYDGTVESPADTVAVIVQPSSAAVDITDSGAILSSVRKPVAGGSLDVVRDGVRPPLTATDPMLEYASVTGTIASEGWIGYQWQVGQTFSSILFQEGMHFADGGWFATLDVQVRRNGVWRSVNTLAITPDYPAIDNGQSFETYTLSFEPATGEAIRIIGLPGGSRTFFSVAELRVLRR